MKGEQLGGRGGDDPRGAEDGDRTVRGSAEEPTDALGGPDGSPGGDLVARGDGNVATVSDRATAAAHDRAQRPEPHGPGAPLSEHVDPPCDRVDRRFPVLEHGPGQEWE